MYWKMSIDLSYPLVTSMGQHDPLDGFTTYLWLQATAAKVSRKTASQDLGAEIAEMAALCEGKRWETDDPLGLGELLCTVYELALLSLDESLEQTGLLDVLLRPSLVSLRSYASGSSLNLPAEYRLAFRELGLSLGLRAIEKLIMLIRQTRRNFHGKNRLQSWTESVLRYAQLRESIETYWLDPSHRRASEWTAHRDINMVMLATSLDPDGYLSSW